MTCYNNFFTILLNYVSSNGQSVGSPRDVLGASACELYGGLKYSCQTPDLPIENFPKECTSFTYCCLSVENDKLIDPRADLYAIHDYLDNILKTDVNLFIYYYHQNMNEWCEAIKSNNINGQTTEMDNLQTFFDRHPGIKGVILTYLYVKKGNSTCIDYSKNLKSYIDLMRKKFPDLAIGIAIMAKKQYKNYQNPKLPWLDFQILDPSVDFYILDMSGLNPCSDEFTQTGVYPLYGNYDYTVDKMKNFLVETGVCPDKLHIEYTINADLKNSKQSECDSFPTSYCQNKEDAKTSMCLDTIQTLVEKGAYARANTAGFIVSNIDLDDFSSDCQCDQPFPIFNALLSGYNGEPPPAPCAAYDRT